MNKTLYILRGIPGAGKSTFVNTKLKPFFEKKGIKVAHYENDMYFTDPVTGEYNWDGSKMRQAIDWCYQHVKDALLGDEYGVVVVSNTSLKPFEYAGYLDLAAETGARAVVLKLDGGFKNVHSVPEETLQRMRTAFDSNPEGLDANEYFATLDG